MNVPSSQPEGLYSPNLCCSALRIGNPSKRRGKPYLILIPCREQGLFELLREARRGRFLRMTSLELAHGLGANEGHLITDYCLLITVYWLLITDYCLLITVY